MKKIFLLVFLFLILLAAIIAVNWRYTPLNDGKYVVSNGSISWHLLVSNGVLTTTAIESKTSNEKLTVSGNDFALRLGHPATIREVATLKRPEDRANPVASANGKVITPSSCRAVMRVRSFGSEKFILYNPALDCNIYLEFDKAQNANWLKRKISLQGNDPNVELVVDDQAHHVEWKFAGKNELGGKGQPLFCDDNWFMALEHPWSDNNCTNGTIKLTQYPCLRFTNNIVNLNSMVIGGGSKLSGRQVFNDYFKSFRRTPRSVNLYNSWNDLRAETLTAKNIISSSSKIQAELKKRGSSIEYCVIDDGWQKHKSIWRTNTEKFPGDFAKLSQDLAKNDLKAGLWLSLSGFFIDADWAKENGYESPYYKYLCLSGQKYNRELRRILTYLIESGNISYFKHDFNYFACGCNNHDHYPNPAQSTEHNINEEINILKYERSLKSDLYQAITSGINPSPWWFEFVDTIWMGGSDQSYKKNCPATYGSAFEMNYRDSALYDLLEVQKLPLPLYAIMTHGIVDGKIAEYMVSNEDDEGWANYTMNYFGRGTKMRELYISPELLTSNRWNVLARGLEWADSIDDCTENTRFFLGNPTKCEPFGYTGSYQDRRYISVRNTGMPPEIKTAQELLLTNEIIEIVYPYHQYLLGQTSLEFEIEGEMVFQAESYSKASLTRPVPVGIRSTVISASATETKYAIYPDQTELNFEIISPIKIDSVLGDSVQLTKVDNKKWKGVVNSSLPAWPKFGDISFKTNGALKVEIEQAEGITAKIKIIDRSKLTPSLCLINDEVPDVETINFDEWRILDVTCLPGKSSFSHYYVPSNSQKSSFKMGAYYIASRKLPQYIITIKHANAPVIANYKKIAPIRQAVERKSKIFVERTEITLSEDKDVKEIINAQFKTIKQASFKVEVFDVNGGKYADKQIYINGQKIGLLPANSGTVSQWQLVSIPIKNASDILKSSNIISFKDSTGDVYKIRNLSIEVELKNGRKLKTYKHNDVYGFSEGWTYSEGKTLAKDGSTITSLIF